MAKKSGLGRGLGSLFEDSGLGAAPVRVEINKEKAKDAAKVLNPKTKASEKKSDVIKKPEAKAEKAGENFGEIKFIPITDIKPNSMQPRKIFNEEALKELADSIEENGLIQPIIVKPAKKGFELVAGERRWRAARLAGLKEIPSIVRELDEKQNAFYALIENMQREDLNIIEEALGIEEIISKYNLTQDEAGKAVGKSRSYITNALRILKLPGEVKDLVNDKKLSAGHARAIAGLEGEALQIEAARLAVKEGWSVRAIENYTGRKSSKIKKPRKRSYSKDIEIRNVEERLSSSIGTKVVINGNEKRGKIELQYFSRSELDRLVEFLEK